MYLYIYDHPRLRSWRKPVSRVTIDNGAGEAVGTPSPRARYPRVCGWGSSRTCAVGEGLPGWEITSNPAEGIYRSISGILSTADALPTASGAKGATKATVPADVTGRGSQ